MLLALLFSFMAVISAFLFPPFNENNQHSKIGNIFEFSESHGNGVVACHMEDILNILKLEDLEILIEALASRTAISPFLILNKLYRKMRNRDAVKEILSNTIDEVPFECVCSEAKIPLEKSRSMSSHVSITDDKTNKNLVPSSMNKLLKMGQILRKDSTFESNKDGEMSNMLPGVFLPPGKHTRLKPPFEASVRIHWGGPLNPITREISVTVSPLMTFIEALRQAESALGRRDDSDVIIFAHSLTHDCYVVNSIADIAQNEESGWKITVTDRNNQVIYDSFCLPNSKDISVKAGWVICLTYVST